MQAPSPARATRILVETLLAFLLAAVIVLVAYQPVKVEGSSMMPGLVESERLFVNRLVFRTGLVAIERYDTIVFQFPRDPSRSFIKRVIALPGESVEIRDGVVWVNGAPLAEPYVPEDYRDTVSMAPLRVPLGHYFVLGDHRSASNDSRGWGFVPRQAIYGRAVFAYWPPERLGRLH
jgi:signal peptidase I